MCYKNFVRASSRYEQSWQLANLTGTLRLCSVSHVPFSLCALFPTNQRLAGSPSGDKWSQGHEAPTLKTQYHSFILYLQPQTPKVLRLQCTSLECKTPWVMPVLEAESQKETAEPGKGQPPPAGTQPFCSTTKPLSWRKLPAAHAMIPNFTASFSSFYLSPLFIFYFLRGLLLHHPHQLRVKHVHETLSRSAGTHKHAPLLPAIAFYSPWVSNKRGLSICLMV